MDLQDILGHSVAMQAANAGVWPSGSWHGRNALPVGNFHPSSSSSSSSSLVAHLANSQLNVTPPSATLIVKTL